MSGRAAAWRAGLLLLLLLVGHAQLAEPQDQQDSPQELQEQQSEARSQSEDPESEQPQAEQGGDQAQQGDQHADPGKQVSESPASQDWSSDRHGQGQDGARGQQPSTTSDRPDRLAKMDRTSRPDKPEHQGHRTQHDGRCSDDARDCPPDSGMPTEAMERRLNVNPHDEPLVPDEDSPDLGFLYARSLSLYADEESNATNVNVRSRSLRNRVLGQTWCSAVVCPVSAALTLANNTGRHSSRTSGKVSQGEAVVACVNCTFSATSVSIVDGESVCASAASTSVARGVCVAVCQWEGADCSCSAGCSSSEMGSDSVHSYGYQVTAATSVQEQLSFLHRLMVRIHNTAEHLNIAAMLDVPGKTRQVRANVERRFGREKSKLVPVILTGSLQ